MVDPEMIRARYAPLSAHLDERSRRLFAASEARSRLWRDRSGIAGHRHRAQHDRPRPQGTGVDSAAGRRADPPPWRRTQVARWTCKSLRRLAGELAQRDHWISHTVVGELLKAQKFSLQANRKTREGDSHPDRDAQFAYIGDSVTTALTAGQPVIAVDTKKKELVGDFKNAGREWRPQGEPEEVRVHDFLIKELGRAVP